jgi:hypothetical protein
LQPIYCSSCGKPNAPNAKFCNECAKPLYDATPAQQQQPYQHPGQQGVKPKRFSIGSILFWIISLGAIFYFITWSYERNFGQMRATIDSFMGWKPTPATKPLYEIPPPASSNTPKPDRTISMGQFNRLQSGMSYMEVIGVLGKEGNKVAESPKGKDQSMSYRWEAGGLASVSATFQNDKLVSKKQYGLD